MAKYKVDISGINTNDLHVLTNGETTNLFIRLKNGEEIVKEEIIKYLSDDQLAEILESQFTDDIVDDLEEYLGGNVVREVADD